ALAAAARPRASNRRARPRGRASASVARRRRRSRRATPPPRARRRTSRWWVACPPEAAAGSANSTCITYLLRRHAIGRAVQPRRPPPSLAIDAWTVDQGIAVNHPCLSHDRVIASPSPLGIVVVVKHVALPLGGRCRRGRLRRRLLPAAPLVSQH